MTNKTHAHRLAPARRRKGGTLGLLIAATVIVLIAIVLVVAWAGRPEKLTARGTETAGEKYAVTADLFDAANQTAPVSAEHGAATGTFFTALSSAISRGDRKAFGESFDIKRMYQEIERQDVLPELTWRQERDFLTGLRLGIGQSMDQYRAGMEWESHEIRRIVELDAPGELLVFVRGRHVDGHSVKMRWWLSAATPEQEDGPLRAFDWEDLDGGWRASSAMGVMAAASIGNAAPWVGQVQQLMNVAPLIANGDYAAATGVLQGLASARFPAGFEAMRLMFLASAYSADERYGLALKTIEQAAAVEPDMPVLEYMRAISLNGLARHEEALAAAEGYIALLGHDAEVQVEVGDAYFGMDRIDDAAGAYRDGLRDTADAVDNLFGLARCLPDGGQQELAEWLAKARSPGAWFEGLAIALINAGELEAVEILAAALEESSPGDPNAAYYLAEVRYDQERFQEAASLLRGARDRAAPEERALFSSAMMDSLIAAGDPLDAYRAADQTPDAFRRAASALAEVEDTSTLRALIAEHRSLAPNDLWLAYFDGACFAIEGSFEQAADAYATGFARANDDESRTMFRNSLVTARYDSGRMMQAYEELKNKSAVARKLASLLLADEDADGFERLVSAHRAMVPRDSMNEMWEAEIHWLRGNYESVITALSTHGRKILDRNPEAVHLFEERMIRSYLRLGRLGDALDAARESTRRDGDPFYEAVVHAAAGRVDETLAAMQRCVAMGYAPDAFYTDVDAGRVLATDTFAELRRRFPPLLEERTSSAGE